MDSDSQDNYQEDINDPENIEANHLAGLKHLSHKIEQLRQTIKANDNGPMDAINHLEQKLSYHTLPTQRTYWGSSKQIHKHFMYCLEENVSRKFIVTRYHSTKWK